MIIGSRDPAEPFWDTASMGLSLQELDSFHRFAEAMLKNGGHVYSLDELVAEWKARDATNAALRQALKEMKAGMGRPVEEVMKEIREEFNLPP